MEAMKLEDAIILALASTAKEGGGAHPLRTDECPGIPQIERLASGAAKWKINQIFHRNRCAYCQLNLRLLREELGIKPWWEQQREWWQKARAILVGLQMVDGYAQSREMVALPKLFSVPAVSLNPRGDVAKTDVEITAIELQDDGLLNLRLSLEALTLTPEDLPLEITLVRHPEGEPFGVFTLPDLLRKPRQSLTVLLPSPLAEAWKGIEHRRELPFRFIIRPAASQVELDQSL